MTPINTGLLMTNKNNLQLIHQNKSKRANDSTQADTPQRTKSKNTTKSSDHHQDQQKDQNNLMKESDLQKTKKNKRCDIL